MQIHLGTWAKINCTPRPHIYGTCVLCRCAGHFPTCADGQYPNPSRQTRTSYLSYAETGLEPVQPHIPTSAKNLSVALINLSGSCLDTASEHDGVVPQSLSGETCSDSRRSVLPPFAAFIFLYSLEVPQCGCVLPTGSPTSDTFASSPRLPRW